MHGFLSLLALASLSTFARTLPQTRNRNGNQGTQRLTAAQQAARIPGGVSVAADGTMLVDDTVTVNNLPIRFRISAPATSFLSPNSPNATAALGINLLLHGDGGQSFFAFPNSFSAANPSRNFIGVALLAPNANLFWGGGSGLNRVDGPAHAKAVADFVDTELGKVVTFDKSKVFFTGVSGGSLLLSGFLIPQELSRFATADANSQTQTGVLLNCGGLAPQVRFSSAAAATAVLKNTRIHFQSTQNELASLQQSIPQAISAYASAAGQVGLNASDINSRLTADNSPVGGHCEFDGRAFDSGIQLMADSFANVVVDGGNGEVQGLGNVNKGVVGTALRFGRATRRGLVGRETATEADPEAKLGIKVGGGRGMVRLGV